ncbi:MAG: endopeptidase La [Campylobacterota bacterium]
MQLNDYEEFPTDLPVLVEDDLFLYPFMISPIFVSDEDNKKAIDFAFEHNSMLAVIPSKPGMEGERDFESVYACGVAGTIMRKIDLPDGRVKILFQGMTRICVQEQIQVNPMIATVDQLADEEIDPKRIDAILDVVRQKVRAFSGIAGQNFPLDLVKTIEENKDPGRIADLICSMLKMKKQTAYDLFIQTNLEKRLLAIVSQINQEIEAYKLQKEIKSKVHSKMDKTNKEYFLREQLKQIQKELGTDNQRDEEIENYRKKFESIKKFLKEDAKKEIPKQINRLSQMHPDSGDASMIQSYLEWVLDIPFGKYSKKALDIKDVQKQLDSDHYALEKAKDRILEYFAVKQLAKLRGHSIDKDGAIICFVGPPGVGKTSLANSISKALKRELVRIALGGLEDVNELRGHRRTYIGAMPGRVVQGLIDAKTMNPVVVFDEIDKVGRNYRGDPTSVLLEILDPEQNSDFRDLYLNFHIDISQTIFIATANDLGTIPAPLRDRMEFIHLSSYTPNQKYQIANRYLIPQELKKHSLQKKEFSVSKKALEQLIENYTREPGVRNLRREIAKVIRRGVRKILAKESDKISVTLKNLKEFVDKEVFEFSKIDKKPQVGVVNGLAWTSVGGDVLKVEAARIKGKGNIQLTGKLGDVMKESAKIAFTCVKTMIDNKDVDAQDEVYKEYDLHIHVPEGATPKDGPSAGITMVTAIASILGEKKVRNDVAMTGEVTLTGEVLPIGGLKEKLIAAYKAGVKTALVPQKNYERDLEDIPKEVLDHVQIKPVTDVKEVLKLALV